MPRRVLRHQNLLRCGLLFVFLGLCLFTAVSSLSNGSRDFPSRERPSYSRSPANRLAESPAAAKAALINLPLSFEELENKRQFLVRGGDYRMLLSSTGASIGVKSRDRARLLRMTLLGANRESESSVLEPLEGKRNYL